MKHRIIIYLSALCIFSACKNQDTSISLSANMLQMTIGDMKTLTATTTPTSDVTWSSSNDSIATVFHGVVTAKGIGNAIITASANGATATCQIYSIGKDGTTLALSPIIKSLVKGETFQFICHDVYGLPLTWSSNNEAIATVNQDGLVTALKGGNATISVTNGAETVSAVAAVEHTWNDYQLVWSDEFDGNTIDTNNWTVEVNGNGGGNNEKQYYTNRPENIRLNNGCLELEARKETYENKEYTSGRINSRDKKAFKYGKIEARICLPSGGGTWPAFWTMGSDWPIVGWASCGEIDIMEHIGNNPTMVSFALHTKEKNGSKGNNWSSRTYMDGIEGTFHTYGIEWQEEAYSGRDKISFTIDGVEYASSMEDVSTMDDNFYWPFNKEHFLILNLAMGGNMGGTINDAIFQNSVIMKVDWVRVYQRTEKE